jgi:hypothetical protein
MYKYQLADQQHALRLRFIELRISRPAYESGTKRFEGLRPLKKNIESIGTAANSFKTRLRCRNPPIQNAQESPRKFLKTHSMVHRLHGPTLPTHSRDPKTSPREPYESHTAKPRWTNFRHGCLLKPPFPGSNSDMNTTSRQINSITKPSSVSAYCREYPPPSTRIPSPTWMAPAAPQK